MRYLTKGHEVTIKAGETLYALGAPIGEDGIYYVVTGSVKLVRRMRDETEFTTSVGPEETFGVVSAMAGNQREEDAIALENSSIYCWTKDSFESAVSLYIEFARMAIQSLSRYLRAVNKELAKVGRF